MIPILLDWWNLQADLSKLQEQFPSAIVEHVDWKVQTWKDAISSQVALALEMMKGWQIPTIDISRLPHLAQLSPKYQKHYFNWNREISENDKEPKVEWNLQYLIWPTWVWTYLNLSEKHQEFVKDIANILLTDDYAENIEENKKNHTRNYDIISEWKQKLKTAHLTLFITRYINLLQDIEMIRAWADKSYKYLFKALNNYKEKNDITQILKYMII
jgi:hypothetical protein